MLIDKTFFVGDINIPNPYGTNVAETLDWYLNKYEPEFLLYVLGYELSRDFAAGLKEDPIADKWKNLRDGVEYTGLDGYPHKWRGIVETVVEADPDNNIRGQYQSMIAHYVFYQFLAGMVTQTSSLGVVSPKAENADVVSPAEKMCRVWNQMVDWINELIYFLNSNMEVYGEWIRYNRIQLRSRFAKVNSMGI